MVNISGILVVVSPKALQESVILLGALPGIDVHYTHPDTGKVIVTQEADNVEAEIEGLRRIKALPQVILAEFVCHYLEEESQRVARGSEDPLRARVPVSLAD